RRYTLGTYPVLSLAEARSRARVLLQQVATGLDPASVKQQERRERADTFAALASLYLERHAKARKRSWHIDERILKRELLPHWGPRLAKDISRRDVRDLLERMIDRGAPQSANRTFALVRKIFNFAVGRELVPVNPCQGLERPAPLTQ